MKRKLLVFLGLAVMLLSFVVYTIFIPSRSIRNIERQFQLLAQGMSSNEVVEIMPPDGYWSRDHMGAFWDHTPLGPEEVASIRSSLRYSVRTVFLPVTFELAFDDAGVLVGRHRYD